MTVKLLNYESGEATLEVTINLKGGLLEVEERILLALNDVGCEAPVLEFPGPHLRR
uniref:Uncharacterized protein n=1 Tax=uncultured Thiotrichaceae bacterium TaxID=298394 RepID=A0A6S6UK39_9GAMM|nr:MAG: Unknown protein [uncultured Thiotrichaceae bacterium]